MSRNGASIILNFDTMSSRRLFQNALDCGDVARNLERISSLDFDIDCRGTPDDTCISRAIDDLLFDVGSDNEKYQTAKRNYRPERSAWLPSP
jgi:hypothetical protein